MQIRINKKLIFMTTILLSLLMILSGCGVSKKDAAAIVNGKAISKSEFDANFSINKQMYVNQLGSDIMSREMESGRTFEDELKQIVLDNLVFEELIIQDAEKQKIVVKDEEVNEAIDEFTTSAGGDEQLKEFLKQNNMTLDFMEQRMRKEMIIDKYRNNFFESIISDEDVKNQYEENKDLYTTIRASHILVETEEEAKDILKQINEGKNFDELTNLSTEPGAAERKGDLGYFARGEMVAEFSEAAFELKPGEISDVVKTDFGYHIIKLTDRKDTFEQVKDDVLISMQSNESAKFDEKLQQLKDEADIETLIEITPVNNEEQDNTEENNQSETQENTDDEAQDDTENNDGE